MLCVKGRFGYGFAQSPERLTTPLIKEDGEFRPASWDEALDLIADRLSQYRGPSFATLCSAKATNEDGYVQQKFSRLVMQSNNIDHCTRLCHAPSVEAMLTSLGSGATSNSYTDYENAACLLVIGCDPTSNHPVAASRMRRAVVERGAKLIVVNPRRIDMCDYADLWLRTLPGTDVALLNGLAKVILDEGLMDGSSSPIAPRALKSGPKWLTPTPRTGRRNYRRPCGGHPPSSANVRRSSSACRIYRGTRPARFLSHLGNGHNPAHQRHAQLPRPAQPGAGRPANWAALAPASPLSAARTTSKAAATPAACPTPCPVTRA